MVGASLLVAGGFLFAFIWSVKSGQYNDSFGSSVRPLFDNETKNSNQESEIIQSNTSNVKPTCAGKP